MSDLIQRLRGNYTIPIRDGAGPLDGKMEFHRDFPTVPIQLEAADALEAKDAEIAVLCEHLICELCEKPAEHFTVCPECYDKVARKPASVPVEALRKVLTQEFATPDDAGAMLFELGMRIDGLIAEAEGADGPKLQNPEAKR